MKLILDATVLIAFYTELQRSDLLKSLAFRGFELLIPNAVYDELIPDKNFEQLKKDIYANLFSVLSPVPSDEIRRLRFRFPWLHDGELEVIWWGQQFDKDEYYCILDDKKARESARKLGLKVKGTVGLLRLLNDIGVISKEERKELCLELVKRGFRFPREWCY